MKLSDVSARPNFFGVGAVEGLQGEITIYDSRPIVTGHSRSGRLQDLSSEDLEATLLAGAPVDVWARHVFDEPIATNDFDETLGALAVEKGLDPNGPFVFVVERQFSNVRLHVVNGACPVHARMKNVDLGEEERPFEMDTTSIAGKLVGVYARNAVGELTHPATSVHAHLVFEDQTTGLEVTGHLERFGVLAGAVLRLPEDGGP